MFGWTLQSATKSEFVHHTSCEMSIRSLKGDERCQQFSLRTISLLVFRQRLKCKDHLYHTTITNLTIWNRKNCPKKLSFHSKRFFSMDWGCPGGCPNIDERFYGKEKSIRIENLKQPLETCTLWRSYKFLLGIKDLLQITKLQVIQLSNRMIQKLFSLIFFFFSWQNILHSTSHRA